MRPIHPRRDVRPRPQEGRERAAPRLPPGGGIGLAHWTPDGFVGGLSRTTGRHVPWAPNLEAALLWGNENRLRELFGSGVGSLRTSRCRFVFRYPSPRLYVEHKRTRYGPLVEEALDASGQKDLARDVEDLVHRFDRSGDGTMVIPIDYLEVVAVKR